MRLSTTEQLDIFSKRVYYLGVFDEFALGVCVSICLNHCLCVDDDLSPIERSASFINNAIENAWTDQKARDARSLPEKPDLRDRLSLAGQPLQCGRSKILSIT